MEMSLHAENTLHNARRRKSLTRVTGTAGRWAKVTPDKVLEVLLSHGVDMNIRTLQRWAKSGLIPTPERGRLGTGGSWADYPDETIPEALTANLLKKVFKLKNDDVAGARRGYLDGERRFFTDTYKTFIDRISQGLEYEAVLRLAEEEKKAYTNAEHALELFRSQGVKQIGTMEDLQKLLAKQEE
jgi:hypothetical protein